MNKEINKFYKKILRKTNKLDDVRDALIVAIRSDDSNLLKKVLKEIKRRNIDISSELKYDPDINDTDIANYISNFGPLHYSLVRGEFASPKIVKTLNKFGLMFDSSEYILSIFNGKPSEVISLISKNFNVDLNSALDFFSCDLAYYFRVLEEKYSTLKLPFCVDKNAIFEPYFFSYMSNWVINFYKTFEKCYFNKEEKKHYLLELIFQMIRHSQINEASIYLMDKAKEEIRNSSEYMWFNMAIGVNNEEVYFYLLNNVPERMKEISYYPETNLKILDSILSNNLLLPSTKEGFEAFTNYIRLSEEVSPDVLKRIYHPSYSLMKDDEGNTPILNAITNDCFDCDYYPLIMNNNDAIVERNKYGESVLTVAQKHDNNWAVEYFTKLGITESEIK